MSKERERCIDALERLVSNEDDDRFLALPKRLRDLLAEEDAKTEQRVVIRKVNEKERKVLQILADSYHPDEWSAYSFKGLVGQTKLELKDVKRSCRSLAKKGLAQYERSLVDGDGMMAGSGYRATEEGAALITPCDICQKRATYDYRVEEDGTQTSNDDEKTRRVLECDEHYKQSAANPPAKQEALI